jgi:predicted phosphodiesterase
MSRTEQAGGAPAGKARVSGLFVVLLLSGHAAFTRTPYLQNPSDSSIVVRWETSAPVPGLVQYGLTTAYEHESTQPGPDSLHELVLAGLERDTIYHYRVISGPDTSSDARFRTAPSSDRPYRFVAFGDTHGDSITQQSVVNRLLLVEPGPGLLLHCGDLTGAGSRNQYRLFFNVEQRLLAGVPLVPSLGNHDVDSIGYWHRFFYLPGNERWYSARFGNAVFHCLDAYSSRLPGSEQYEWLRAELQADSADPDVRHIFVWFHQPPYTTNNAYSGDTIAQRYLVPLFEQYGVGIVFCGHVHAYEHSLVNGVHYLTVGGGGAALSTSWRAQQPWTIYREATYHFALFDVRGDTVHCKGIKPTGAVFDSFALAPAQTRIAEPAKPGLRHGLTARLDCGRVEFGFALGAPGSVRLAVYDAIGRARAVPVRAILPAGAHRRDWASGSVPAGRYFAVLDAAGDRSVVPISLAR